MAQNSQFKKKHKGKGRSKADASKGSAGQPQVKSKDGAVKDGGRNTRSGKDSHAAKNSTIHQEGRASDLMHDEGKGQKVNSSGSQLHAGKRAGSKSGSANTKGQDQADSPTKDGLRISEEGWSDLAANSSGQTLHTQGQDEG